MKKKVYILGLRSALAKEFLDFFLEKGFYVYMPDINITDNSHITRIVEERPDYLINCAAMSSNKDCNENPIAAARVNQIAVAEILETIKLYSPKTKFLNVGSDQQIIGENIYGLSKKSAAKYVENYRKDGLWAVMPICSQFQSKYSNKFVLNKIISWALSAKSAIDNYSEIPVLQIGKLSNKITIIAARDIIEGLWAVLDSEEPHDYVLSAERKYSISEILEEVMNIVGIEFITLGKEFGNDKYCLFHKRFIPLVRNDPAFVEDRVTLNLTQEIDKTESDLGWVARDDFKNILTDLINHSKNLQ